MPMQIGTNIAKQKLAANDLVLCFGVNQLRTPKKHERMHEPYETIAKAAKTLGKSMGIGGLRHDVEFQSWLLKLGVRYLTSASGTLYILSGGRADVKQIRGVAAGVCAGTP
jgi:hypothetical protein